MGDAAYAFIGPLAFLGAIDGLLCAILAPVIFPSFRRPYTTAWAVSSLGLGGAVFIDQFVVQQRTVAGAAAWACGTAAGLGIIVPLIWYRIRMWALISGGAQRRQEEERNARYRPKDFSRKVAAI